MCDQLGGVGGKVFTIFQLIHTFLLMIACFVLLFDFINNLRAILAKKAHISSGGFLWWDVQREREKDQQQIEINI